MAKKTIKKTKPAIKKAAVKKAPVKSAKTVAKKQVKKTTVRPTIKPVVVAPVECGCDKHCCCCRGRSFIGFCIKVVILCIVFLLGCISAPWLMRGAHQSMMRHIEFSDNGCVVMESVKCPKMLEVLATADVNNDGCVSREEFKAIMPRKPHGAPAEMPNPMPADAMEAPVAE